MISYSHHDRFHLYKYFNDIDLLFVADRTARYYVPRCGVLSRAICDVIQAGDYDNAIFLGASKAGYGALRHIAAMAPLDMRTKLTAVVFSPQTSIYPVNPNLGYPTYKRMIETAETHDGLRADLERYGSLPENIGRRNLRVHCAYGLRNRTDRIEAGRLRGASTTYLSLDLRSHLSILPFLCDTSDANAVNATINGLYGRSGDEDLADIMAADVAQTIRQELLAIPRLKPLKLFISDYLETGDFQALA